MPRTAVSTVPRRKTTEPTIWVVGYYPGYKQAGTPLSTINWQAYTHIYHFSVGVNPAGAINQTMNSITQQFMTDAVLAAHNAGKKISICVGGGGDSETNWASAIGATYRSTFVTNLVNLMTNNGYDGIDLDFEPATANDLAGVYASDFTAFVQALRAAMPAGKELSIANPGSSTLATYLATLAPYFDKINLMTYDMNYGLGLAWHHTSLYKGSHTDAGNALPSANTKVDQLIAAGIAKSKIGMGCGFYSQDLTGPTTLYDTTAISARTQTAHKDLTTTSHKRDPETGSPYIEGASNVIFYDDEISIALKMQYLRTKLIGGIIVFEITHENSSTHPLSNVIRDIGRKGYL